MLQFCEFCLQNLAFFDKVRYDYITSMRTCLRKKEEFTMQAEKITALYARLSGDDECSFWYKGRLLQRPNKLVVNRDDFFFAFAVTPHIGGFVDCDFFNQLVEHETV